MELKTNQRKLYELVGSPAPIGYLWEFVSVADVNATTLSVWFPASLYKDKVDCYHFLGKVAKELQARGHIAKFEKDLLRITLKS